MKISPPNCKFISADAAAAVMIIKSDRSTASDQQIEGRKEVLPIPQPQFEVVSHLARRFARTFVDRSLSKNHHGGRGGTCLPALLDQRPPPFASDTLKIYITQVHFLTLTYNLYDNKHVHEGNKKGTIVVI